MPRTRFALGKKRAKRDKRTLTFAAIVNDVKVPERYVFDEQHGEVPTPEFANRKFGCCVIAGRAHQTLRFELAEQKKLITITDKEVLDEYFTEAEGFDDGLVIIDSLKLWRLQGWKVGGEVYKIRAFSVVDYRSQDSIKRAIYLDVGIGLGLLLPKTSEDQLKKNQPWSVVKGDGSAKGSWGGHYVYGYGFDKDGVWLVTHGMRKLATWEFITRYADECYAIIDDVNTAKKRRGLSLRTINTFLKQLQTR